jgi:Holliday junction resolvase
MNYNLFPSKLRENEIQKQLLEVLRASGWLAIRMNSGAVKVGSRFIRNYIIHNNGKSSGFPDIFAIKNGEILLIEVKRAGGKVSPAQIEFHELVKKHGSKVHVIDNVDNLEKIINGKSY